MEYSVVSVGVVEDGERENYDAYYKSLNVANFRYGGWDEPLSPSADIWLSLRKLV
jgi:hypothetical protein